jgi:UDP-GlcNAc:undecaprenyl-phosphate GlcNAc-1-phosphate transferase
LLAFLLPLVVSALGTAGLIRVAPRLGLIDLPGERKVHTNPTPRAGGLAIYAALVLTTLALESLRTRADLRWLLALGLGIVLLGVLDDRRPLPWQLRLAVQLVLALAAVWALRSDWPLGWQLLGVLWVVTQVNAFNMLDNMDAQSAGVAWVAAGAMALAQLLASNASAVVELAFMGAVTGFLLFNWPPARIFMGDAGSTFLGFFLALRSLGDDFLAPAEPRTWAVPVCLLAVPCYDLGTVVTLRLWQRKSPFHADKQHLSHRLVDLGLSKPGAVRVIHLLAAVAGLAGVIVARWPETAVVIVPQLLVLGVAIGLVEYVRHFRR